MSCSIWNNLKLCKTTLNITPCIILLGSGCEKCTCDLYGSVHNDCDDVTGQCVCKPGKPVYACLSFFIYKLPVQIELTGHPPFHVCLFTKKMLLGLYKYIKTPFHWQALLVNETIFPSFGQTKQFISSKSYKPFW